MSDTNDSDSYSGFEEFDEKWFRAAKEGRLRLAFEYARMEGIKSALSESIDMSGYVDRPIPTVFGRRWAKHFSRVAEELSDTFEEHFEDFLILSMRFSVYARAYDAALKLGLSMYDVPTEPEEKHDDLENKDQTKKIVRAWWLYLRVPSELDAVEELCEGTQLDMPVLGAYILYSMSLVWFYDAAECYEKNVSNAFDILYEASEASSFSQVEFAKANTPEKNNPASVLAKRRHAENYALAEYVRSYWRENIDPALSAQKAAEEIIRSNVVTLSHKKIAEIISALRKAEAQRK